MNDNPGAETAPLGARLDAKRYFVGTKALWFEGDTLVIETEHNLDPWVLSGGVS